MNFWHMQLHPGNKDWSSEKIKDLVHYRKTIGVGDFKGAKPFLDDMQIGDIVFVHHKNYHALVEITSDCTENEEKHSDKNNLYWFVYIRKVKILDESMDKALVDEFKNKTSTDWKKGMFLPKTIQKISHAPYVQFWYDKVKTS